MKALLLFLLGAVVGIFGYHLYREREARLATVTPVAAPQVTPTTTPPPTSVESTSTDFGTRAREAARDTQNAIGNQLREWNLTPDDLRDDLRRGTEIVRTKAKQAGAELSDARILTVIKAKFVLDRDLSALDINVDVSQGRVTLKGRVATVALVGRAIALALETDGVMTVASQLTITASP